MVSIVPGLLHQRGEIVHSSIGRDRKPALLAEVVEGRAACYEAVREEPGDMSESETADVPQSDVADNEGEYRTGQSLAWCDGKRSSIIAEFLAGERHDTIRKSDAKAQTKAFIQNIHHFRDEYIKDKRRSHRSYRYLRRGAASLDERTD